MLPVCIAAIRSFRIGSGDLLVVPEVHAAEQDALNLTGRRIVFVQASSYIAPGLGNAKGYRELGYRGAIAIMPHVREILERHYGMEAPVIPPCVAPYFFAADSKQAAARNVRLCSARRRGAGISPSSARCCIRAPAHSAGAWWN